MPVYQMISLGLSLTAFFIVLFVNQRLVDSNRELMRDNLNILERDARILREMDVVIAENAELKKKLAEKEKEGVHNAQT